MDLGVDQRVFQRLSFPRGFEAVYLSWIKPFEGEQLHDYALRLSEKIDASEPYGILGLSFGGMLASEMARRLQPDFTILISSAASRLELPVFYRLVGALGLDRILPARILTLVTPFTFWLFGAKPGSERQLLRDIIRDTDPVFLKWAIRSILTWKADLAEPDLFRIHGTNDHIIPAPVNGIVDKIRGAGHLMVYTHADEVSAILAKKL